VRQVKEAYEALVGKPKWKTPLERPKSRKEMIATQFCYKQMLYDKVC
jgi:hypothetical protein